MSTSVQVSQETQYLGTSAIHCPVRLCYFKTALNSDPKCTFDTRWRVAIKKRVRRPSRRNLPTLISSILRSRRQAVPSPSPFQTVHLSDPLGRRYLCTCVRPHMYVCTYIQAYAHMSTCMRAYIRMYVHTHKHTCMHACTITSIHACIEHIRIV